MKLKILSSRIFLFLLFVWFFESDSYSQKFTIESTQRQGQWKFGKHDDINVIMESPDEVYPQRNSAATHIIDISKRTMTAYNSRYESGINVNNLKISKKKDTYIIEYVDGNKPITLYLDIENETMRFLYYHEVTENTWVQSRLNLKISKS